MRRALWIAAAALIAVVVVTWDRARTGDAPREATAARRLDPGRPALGLRHGRHVAANPPPRVAEADRPAPEPPIIAAVTLEKTEACEGEELAVSVDAHTASGHDDAFLHGSIAGRDGLVGRIVVRRDPDGRMARQTIVVHGRDGAHPTVIDIPEVQIRDCVIEYEVAIASRPHADEIDHYDFSATVLRGSYVPPFTPVSFRWDFGDTARLETAETVVSHDYSRRPQDRLYTDFLVAVEATDAHGRTVRGRTAVSLRNEAFERLARAGEVAIFGTPTPRFAVLDDMGTAHQRVALWHHHDRAVTLSDVTTRTTYRDGRVEEREATPLAALGLEGIPSSGRSIDLRVAAPEAATIVAREIVMTGTTEDGLPAFGAFTLRFSPIEDPPLEIDIGPPPTVDDEPRPPPAPRHGVESVPEKGK